MKRRIAIATLALIVCGLAFGVFWLTQLSAGKKVVALDAFAREQTFSVRAPSWPFRKDIFFVEVTGQLDAAVPISIRADGEPMGGVQRIPPGRVVYETFARHGFTAKELEAIVHPSHARGFIELKLRCGR